MENNHGFLKGFLGGILAAFACVLLAGAVFLFTSQDAAGISSTEREEVREEGAETESLSENDEIYKKIQEIEEVIDQNFLDEVDKEALADGIYSGLVSGLDDPYSVYYNAEDLASMMEATSGSYYGIGATMSQEYETGIITIVTPFEGAPAAESGILPGDKLYKVNDTEVTGMDLTAVVAMIKGEEGTTVDLSIAREGENDYLDFTVERRQIEVPTISHEMLDGNIGYIAVTEFDEVTTDQFAAALEELEEQGMESLVVDLRGNPGGVLSVVCEMLEQILPEGLIVYTEDKYGERNEYYASGEHEFTKPMAVLVNGNSASASEIFAGAVQDYGIGTIVGTTTYGKGIVQKIVNLSDNTAVKLTISKYYTPNGNNIHEIGIEPDVEVELDEELRQQISISHEEDNQLQKAIEVLSE